MIVCLVCVLFFAVLLVQFYSLFIIVHFACNWFFLICLGVFVVDMLALFSCDAFCFSFGICGGSLCVFL